MVSTLPHSTPIPLSNFLLTLPCAGGLINNRVVYGKCESKDRDTPKKNYIHRSPTSLPAENNADALPLQLLKYMRLDQKGTAMAEYIWIDSYGGVRSKSKVSSCIVSSPASHTHTPRA